MVAAGSLGYAGADPYGGTGDLVFGTLQARRRPLRVAGPLPDERGRLGELLHIVWLPHLTTWCTIRDLGRNG